MSGERACAIQLCIVCYERKYGLCCSLCLRNKSACTEGCRWVTQWSLLQKIEGTEVSFSSPHNPALDKSKQGKCEVIPISLPTRVPGAEHQLLFVCWKADANKSIPSCSHLLWASTWVEGAWMHSPAGEAFYSSLFMIFIPMSKAAF